jgi:hypothetical protein
MRRIRIESEALIQTIANRQIEEILPVQEPAAKFAAAVV